MRSRWFGAVVAGIVFSFVLLNAIAPVAAHQGKIEVAVPNGVFQFYEQGLQVIPAAAFSQLKDPHDPFQFYYLGGYLRGGPACVTAPVYLPNGSQVDKVYASLYDNDGSGSARVYLYRSENFTTGTTEMAFLSTSTDLGSIQVIFDATINEPRIEYPRYSYYVHVCLDSFYTRLYSVRIYYKTFTYLPVIMKETGG